MSAPAARRAPAPPAAPLREQRCEPVGVGGALDDAALPALLRQVPRWRLVGGALERRFAFADFHHTMAFVNAVAWIAQREDHHPDLQVGHSHCTVRLRTHSVDGLSRNDFICAALVDALLADDA